MFSKNSILTLRNMVVVTSNSYSGSSYDVDEDDDDDGDNSQRSDPHLVATPPGVLITVFVCSLAAAGCFSRKSHRGRTQDSHVSSDVHAEGTAATANRNYVSGAFQSLHLHYDFSEK